ncbi:hypothetical protein ACA29_23215 [Lederbergia galactosidilytica]|uniref:Uncharacterized protein n=1 Tax=Lederbergia galactosidilytica TaxID=217031 RepID=A0A0Q9XMF0_9BACI|nr:hypothetical protein ACA29_23215 [Lederbergia galactosidilytica]
MLTKCYVSVKAKWNRYVNNERGAQALEWIALGMLEWIALGMLVLAIMGAIAATMVEGDTSMGEAVKSQLAKMINSLGGE